MQDPVVIMNFTHIYEDETFYISEQKSPAPALTTGSGSSVSARAASCAPSIVSGSPAPARAASCAPSIGLGSPAPARAVSPRCMSVTAARTPHSPFTPTILDFTTLPGTTGFCDDAAADEIRRRIADFPARGLHFLDNGNFHYLTRFWCEKILMATVMKS